MKDNYIQKKIASDTLHEFLVKEGKTNGFTNKTKPRKQPDTERLAGL